MKRFSKIAIILLIIVFASFYFFAEGFNSFINAIIKLFSSMNIEEIVNYIRSYGIYAGGISFFLMIFQSLAAPLPAFLITFANAAIFGWWKGAILSWVSSMAGATVCFYIARLLGRDAVEKLVSKFAMESFDNFFVKYGRYTILICRLLPFVSFDYISYGAGLTSMGFLPFFIASGIGQLPATLIYSYVGGMLTGGTQMFVTGLLILFAISIFIMFLKKVSSERKNNREE